MQTTGLMHIYGIVNNDEGGLERGARLVGMNGAPLHLITDQGLAVLASAASTDNYDLLDKSSLVRMLVAHQQVTEQIMPHVPVLLPMKFGTLLTTSDIHALLRMGYDEFREHLQRLAGKVELELVVTWQPERVFAQLAQDPAIVHLRAGAAGMDPIQLEQIQAVVGQRVKITLDARREKYQQQIIECFKDTVSDVEINPALNDKVVANLGFLLLADRQTAFAHQVEELDSQLQDQLNFKIVGPLPPYSFGTIEVLKISPTQMAQAIAILGITDDVVTAGEIQIAYRQQAQRYHPDHAPDNPMAKVRFNEINNAYQLVKHCCDVRSRRAHLASMDCQLRCDLAQAAAEGVLLINFCRSSELTS